MEDGFLPLNTLADLSFSRTLCWRRSKMETLHRRVYFSQAKCSRMNTNSDILSFIRGISATSPAKYVCMPLICFAFQRKCNRCLIMFTGTVCFTNPGSVPSSYCHREEVRLDHQNSIYIPLICDREYVLR